MHRGKLNSNQPSCVPVENKVMENVHIQHREKAKPHLHKESNAIIIRHKKKTIKTLCTESRNSAGGVSTHIQAPINAQSFPHCWLKWVRINYSNANKDTESDPDICIAVCHLWCARCINRLQRAKTHYMAF